MHKKHSSYSSLRSPGQNSQQFQMYSSGTRQQAYQSTNFSNNTGESMGAQDDQSDFSYSKNHISGYALPANFSAKNLGASPVAQLMNRTQQRHRDLKTIHEVKKPPMAYHKKATKNDEVSRNIQRQNSMTKFGGQLAKGNSTTKSYQDTLSNDGATLFQIRKGSVKSHTKTKMQLGRPRLQPAVSQDQLEVLASSSHNALY